MTSARVLPSLTIAVISRQSFVWVGLQSILARMGTVVHVHPWRMPDVLRIEPFPDVFMLDLETNQEAIDRIRQIRELAPKSKIVVISGVEDWRGLKEACTYGVDGVILTVQPPEIVLAVLETLLPAAGSVQARASGSVAMEVNHKLPPTVDSTGCPPVEHLALTVREQAVIQLVQHGLSNKEIACKLLISDNTVRHHLTSIFDKLGVSDRKKLMVRNHQFHATHA